MQEMITGMLGNIVMLIGHESSVVHSYAAHCIGAKILALNQI